jgi:exosortase
MTAGSKQRTWDEIIPPATRVRVAIVALLLIVVYWAPIRGLLVARWLNDGNWSHGFLIPLFSLYFLYMRRDELPVGPVKPSYFGAIVVAMGLAMYFTFAWVVPMGYPQGVSIVISIFGLTLLLGGWRVMRVAWFPILFLLLAIPLPHRTYVELSRPLREWSSVAGATMMPMFMSGLHTQAQALVIDYLTPDGRTGQLNVEQACSGMRLLMSFFTIGLAMSYLGDRPIWQRWVMVVCCVPIAVFCNTIRVTLTGLATVAGRADLAQGTPHQLLGIVMLALALGLFWLLGYVLSNLLVDVQDEPAGAGQVKSEGSSER